jgi:hypothetical protein
VLIRGGGILSPNNVNNLYNSQAGVASSIVNTVTAADLVGQDLLIIWEPTTAMSVAELGAMATYLAGGNKIAFFGENLNFPSENANVNAAITALGGTMQINAADLFDGGINFATTGGGQILSHPLTTGLSTIQYGAVSGVSGVTGGNGLFLTQDLANTWAGTEAAGGGELLLVADSNLETFLALANNNDDFFLNLLSNSFVSPPVVPEPGALALLAIGALFVGFRRRRPEN